MRGATSVSFGNSAGIVFQSTLPMRGATIITKRLSLKAKISIHAPHAGSDCNEKSCSFYAKFQSTLPMRGATRYTWRDGIECRISIHAPHAGSDTPPLPEGNTTAISIHAPHAGSDCRINREKTLQHNFNPRSPCGERLKRSCQSSMTFLISIHAPHAGSDLM